MSKICITFITRIQAAATLGQETRVFFCHLESVDLTPFIYNDSKKS